MRWCPGQWKTRNVLARILFFLNRFDEAYDELVAIGPHATEFPWGYWGMPARSSSPTAGTS